MGCRRACSPAVLLKATCFRGYAAICLPFILLFIQFPKPVLSGAVVSSFNQFSEGRRTPGRTVGSGHCNNNNAKSNLNYALKRLGRNNPRHKHKRGGGRARSTARTVDGGGSVPSPLCGRPSFPVGGICRQLC